MNFNQDRLSSAYITGSKQRQLESIVTSDEPLIFQEIEEVKPNRTQRRGRLQTSKHFGRHSNRLTGRHK